MGTRTLPNNMKVALVLAFVASAYAAPDTRFTCSECVSEMHKLGGLVKMGAVPIHDYIVSNYCPTLEHNHDQDFCVDSLSKYYVGMLFAIVNHYFVDGAVHVCQTGGACEAAKEYTWEELSRAWSGWRLTLRTPSWWQSTRSTWSRTSVSMTGRTARSWWWSTSPPCT